MQDNKSPGDDGLPREFYKTFEDMIAPDLAEIFNTILLTRQTHNSFKNAIVSLLYKKNDARLLKNW